ncbi:MAG: hypothetical protein H7Y31_18350 [Chitinophagaceae bacterium]|nr:hypothetical protein [Chitinophagaceae bacterium]
MNDIRNKNGQSDEIDLAEFFRSVGSGIRSLLRLIGGMFRTLFANFLLFGGLLVLVALLVYSIRFIIPQYYRSEATFVSQDLDTKFCVMVINSAETIAKLNAANNSAIHNIAAEVVADNFNISRYDSAVSLFKVTILTKDKSIISQVASGIVTTLNGNEYALKQRKNRVQVLTLISREIMNKLESLESLKARDLQAGTSVVDLYQSEYFFRRELIGTQRKLEMDENIEVLQPFYSPDKPHTPGLRKIYLSAILGGVLLSVIITLVFARRRT